MLGPHILELSKRLRASVVRFAQPGPAVRGPRAHLHRRRAGARPPGADRDARRRARAARARRSSTSAPRRAAGFRPAIEDQVSFHGAALPPISLTPGTDAYDGSQERHAVRSRARCRPNRWPTTPRRRPAEPAAPKKHPNYTAVFAAELIEAARTDRRIVGITAGMPTGTGMSKFAEAFPDRVFDVGIAEQHAVTLATGLAMGGMRPVVALYSTFLQRAFDQTVHDVCQNDQPVLIAVDRSGLVGEDGTSHQGMFTLPAQRQLPNLVIASPKDEQELRSLLRTGAGAGSAVRAALPARRRDSGWRRWSRSCSRSGRARRCARAATCCSSASGPIVARVHGGRGVARGRGLVGRRHQRPVRQAARSAAHPGRGARQAARRDVRGERRDRRLRERRARADRGGPPGRSVLPRRAGPGRSASRATGSSTTGPWRTCVACCGSTRRALPTRSARRSRRCRPRQAAPAPRSRPAEPSGAPSRRVVRQASPGGRIRSSAACRLLLLHLRGRSSALIAVAIF